MHLIKLMDVEVVSEHGLKIRYHIRERELE